MNHPDLAENVTGLFDNDLPVDESLSQLHIDIGREENGSEASQAASSSSKSVCPETVGIQNGFPSMMPSQEEQMTEELLPERIAQLAITTFNFTIPELEAIGLTQEQYKRVAGAKRQLIFARILTSEARATLAQIALVSPNKARRIEDYILRSIQKGHIIDKALRRRRMQGLTAQHTVDVKQLPAQEQAKMVLEAKRQKMLTRMLTPEARSMTGLFLVNPNKAGRVDVFRLTNAQTGQIVEKTDPELEVIRQRRIHEYMLSLLHILHALFSCICTDWIVDVQGNGQTPEQQREAKRVAEAKRQLILTRVLTSEARARLARIALVNPNKARGVEDIILRIAQTSQIVEKVSEERLISLLEYTQTKETQNSHCKASMCS